MNKAKRRSKQDQNCGKSKWDGEMIAGRANPIRALCEDTHASR